MPKLEKQQIKKQMAEQRFAVTLSVKDGEQTKKTKRSY